MKTKTIFFAVTIYCSSSASFSQNIAVNTSGTAAAAANMFEVSQSSATNNTVGIFSTHTGAATNAYAIWAAVTAGTNKYAMVVPLGNGFVGIGSTTPQNSLHVVSDIPTTTTNLHPYRTGMIVEGDQNTYGGRISIRQANDVPSLTLFRTNGTFAAPTALLNGEVMGRIALGGYDGSVVNSFFGLNAVAAENWTAVAHGSHLTFGTVNIGAGWGGTEKARLTSEGHMGIGTTNPGARLDVVYPGTVGTYASKILHSGNAGSAGIALAVSNGYATSSASGSYEVFGAWGNSFASNYLSVRDNGHVGIGTLTPGVVPGWAALSNMRILEVSGDGSAGTFTDGLLMLSNNRATATVGDQAGALCFAHKNNPGNFPAVICSYLTGAGGANGFGAKMEFHTKANNVLGHLLRMVIDQNGYLGIGTAAPAAHVDIYDLLPAVPSLNVVKDFTGFGNINAAFIGGVDFAKTNTGIYILQKDALGFGTATTYLLNVVENGNSKMVVTGQGNVGIGTVPAEILTVHVAVDQNVGFQSIGGIPTILAHNDAWSSWQDIGLGNNVLVAKSSGRVGIGTTNPCTQLEVVGDLRVSGWVYGNWAGSSACPSDIRYKKEITPLVNSLNGILKLQGVNYFFKADEFPNKFFSEDKQVGFIAQDIEKVFPDLVKTGDDGYKAVDYSRLAPVLVEAIKEQQSMIDQLKDEKAISDARIEKLEKMVGLLVQTSQK